ncbi:RBBP9/YdeN family alpha/beta hydrolase [Ensifer adhaerens]|uniref:RBBP9/YdeN family alpha/beta hydrolase n=1 Tax=Ensifer adhaerens TaxID=106592 RepID=UPI003D01EF0D
MRDIIILPGIGNSGETHWQSHWERANPGLRRFQPSDWDRPNLADWIAALDSAVASADEPPLLVAHSLACLLVAHWQKASVLPVAGAFLVAVPDPASPAFPAEAAGFAAVPAEPFHFPSLVVASSNDPFGSVGYAQMRAAQWGSGLVEVGALGHINGRSGLGDWSEGRTLFRSFVAGAAHESASLAVNG